jgi:phosphopantetheine--protein transferase-like protein
VFGLSVDDITVGSFHGTGTHANDLNESDVTNAQMAHLGRTPGQPLYVVAQKHLTGHPKGAAAAWMINGALQSLSSGIVPGNRNGEDIDEELRGFSHLAYISRPLRLGEGGVRAVLVKSFGFGQAGGEVLLVHPDYLLASLEPDVLASYSALRSERERSAQRHAQDILSGARKFVGVKAAPPYSKAQEQRVYLDPTARARRDAVTGEFTFSDGELSPTLGSVTEPPSSGWGQIVKRRKEAAEQEAASLAASLRDTATSTIILQSRSGEARAPLGVGVDVEPLHTFSTPTDTFLSRNFTPAEASYCAAAPDPAASLAGRWAAKEAVAKALSAAAAAVLGAANFSLPGCGASLLDIEIVPTLVPLSRAPSGEGAATTSGAPRVRLTGRAEALAARVGLAATGGSGAHDAVKVTISHSGDYAVAVAVVGS